jgi:hypothetical protein
MPGDFPFDVFLSHSAKDKVIVRDIAASLTLRHENNSPRT